MSAQPQQTYAATDGYELAVVERVTYVDNETASATRRAIAQIRDMTVTVPSSVLPLRQRIRRAACASPRI